MRFFGMHLYLVLLVLLLLCHYGISWSSSFVGFSSMRQQNTICRQNYLSHRGLTSSLANAAPDDQNEEPSKNKKRKSEENVVDSSSSSSPKDTQRRDFLSQSSLAAVAAALGLTLPVDPNSSTAQAAMTALDSSERQRIDVFERAAPSVVYIDTFTERRDVFTTNVLEVPLGTGSGFVWDNEGHIVTNFHVVRDAKTAQVAILTKGGTGASNVATPFGKLASTTTQKQQSSSEAPVASQPPAQPRNPFDISPTGDILPYSSMRPSSSATSRSVYKAKVVGVDPSKDIAVLKVNAPASELSPITVGTSTGLRVGQAALAIGNPFGLDHTLTAGIISGIGREVRSPTGRPITNVIQSDAAINRT